MVQVGCFADIPPYCAPGTPECTASDAGAAEQADQAVADAAPDASEDGGSAEASGDVAAAADTGTADTTSCDPSKTPSEDPCAVDEAFAIFVSPMGSDTNPGTRTMPVATIGRALSAAKAASKRVYVCAGTYAEKVTVGSALDGVSLYGGLDCSSWAYSAGNTVTVAPPSVGFALELDGLTAGVTIEDVTFVAQNANPAHAGESSIAAFANSAQNVVLRRVGLVAGTGTDGAAGASAGASADGGTNNWFGTAPSYPELNGHDAADGGPGASTACRCADGTSSTGGQGGGGAASQMPAAGLPNYGDDAGAGTPGSNSAQCARGGAGLNGLDAPMGGADMPSALRGSSSSNGWSAAAGTAGSNGKPGQGGGGGGDGVAGIGGGGGGACGGCGGAGGKPGMGGGSSIALLSFNSNVSLSDCTLTAHAAGRGGAGGNGEPGQGGSFVGGNGAAGGCPGGGGGAGGGGNGAQGGPGGISAGIVFSGNAPIFNGATAAATAASLPGVTVSSATAAGGGKGAAGAAASTSFGKAGADGPASVAGLSQPVVGL
jgi:hypothetical protein